MNDFTPTPYRSFFAQLMLSLSLLVLLLAMATNSFQQRTLGNTLLKDRFPMVSESTAAQKTLQSLAEELIELAPTNEAAKAIVAKYNIQRQAPVAPSTSPEDSTPAPTPVP